MEDVLKYLRSSSTLMDNLPGQWFNLRRVRLPCHLALDIDNLCYLKLCVCRSVDGWPKCVGSVVAVLWQ